MKTNLKKIKENAQTGFTISNDLDCADENEEQYDDLAMMKWIPASLIENFEKELRARLAYVRRMEKEGLEEDRDKFVWERETYKEILGEGETP